jgi:hypothetical protein
VGWRRDTRRKGRVGGKCKEYACGNNIYRGSEEHIFDITIFMTLYFTAIWIKKCESREMEMEIKPTIYQTYFIRFIRRVLVILHLDVLYQAITYWKWMEKWSKRKNLLNKLSNLSPFKIKLHFFEGIESSFVLQFAVNDSVDEELLGVYRCGLLFGLRLAKLVDACGFEGVDEC